MPTKTDLVLKVGEAEIKLIGFDPKTQTVDNIIIDQVTLHLKTKDQPWQAKLSLLDLAELTIDDLIVDRTDGEFFKILITQALGYIYPMIFETLNKSDLAGTICLAVRTTPGGKKYVLAERKRVINYKGEVESRLRAFRSSISSPEGSPIPKRAKKGILHNLGLIDLNDMRIAGPVQCYVLEQPFWMPTEHNQELVSFSEFAKSGDAPGKAVLFAYEHL